MNDSIIARRYAKAFFQLGLENKKQQDFASDLKGLLGLYNQDENFRFVINNPVISNSKKKALFKKLFDGKIDDQVLNFLNVLISKSREEYLPDIARAFIRMYQEHANIQEVHITSAFEMNTATVAEIEKMLNDLSGKKSEIHTKINSELIGGFILKVDDSQLDASVSGQLKSIKKQLSK
jgi:F-type H+-transporting ATPase subunit delta